MRELAPAVEVEAAIAATGNKLVGVDTVLEVPRFRDRPGKIDS